MLSRYISESICSDIIEGVDLREYYFWKKHEKLTKRLIFIDTHVDT